MLYAFVNPLTMWLNLSPRFIGYAVIYTVVLKPMTPQNIVIGGASGGDAAGARLGRRSRAGSPPEALLLFLIIFAWTPARISGRSRSTAPRISPRPGCPWLPVTHGHRFYAAVRAALQR